jgi:hypothetical protein
LVRPGLNLQYLEKKRRKKKEEEEEEEEGGKKEEEIWIHREILMCAHEKRP